jgi:quercetin dioxygenase-like cupin family protein
MEPVIKSKNYFPNPILAIKDGVPTVVSLYHDHKPGESSKHHSHEWEHQVYITRGTGVVWVDGHEYPIREGDFILVPPNSTHHFKNTGSSILSRITFNPKESEEFL